MKNSQINIYLIFGILLINIPLFFDIYRQCAFNIVPHDDYVPYLLYLLDKKGSIPGSPTGYRLFSVLVAIPFYYLLPLFKFTLLKEPNNDYLLALEALSFVTYLASSFSSFLIYKITRNRFNGDEVTSLLAVFISLLLFRFTAIYSIDPTAILMICILIYYLDYKYIFTFLLILSVGFNEKIIFLFFMLFAGRSCWKISKHFSYFIISFFAFGIYFLVRKIVNLPGHEYMMQPYMFLTKAMHTIGLLWTAKSFILNWLPGIITFALFFFAKKEYKLSPNNNIFFTPVDFLPLFGFIIISLITDMQFTIGRILLFCFPLYLPLATIYMVRSLRKTNKH